MVQFSKKKAVSILLLITFSLVFLSPSTIRVKANDTTIFITADGDVVGTDKIVRDGNTYTFIDDVSKPIVVQKDYIIIDGAGYNIIGPPP